MMPIQNIADKYGADTAALILICRVFLETSSLDEIHSFTAAYTVNWQEVHRLSKWHRIRPVANQVIARLNISASVKDKLEKECLGIAVKNFDALKEIVRVYGRLQQAGINAIPYKGVIAAHIFYNNVALREFSDIDFMIQTDEAVLARVKAVFAKEDYTPMADIPEAYNSILFQNTCEFYFNKYDDSARKYHTEFHWRPYHPVFDLPGKLSNDILLSQPDTLSILGRQINILNTTSHFIAITINHGVKSDWAALKYLVDFAVIIKNGSPDYRKIENISKAYKFNNALNTGLCLCFDLLGIDTGLSKKPADYSSHITALLSNKLRSNSMPNKLLHRLKIMDNDHERLNMVMKYIKYTYTPSLLDYKFLPLPEQAHFIYFFIKPIRKLFFSLRK